VYQVRHRRVCDRSLHCFEQINLMCEADFWLASFQEPAIRRFGHPRCVHTRLSESLSSAPHQTRRTQAGVRNRKRQRHCEQFRTSEDERGYGYYCVSLPNGG
jgi:hypothetical protein